MNRGAVAKLYLVLFGLGLAFSALRIIINGGSLAAPAADGCRITDCTGVPLAWTADGVWYYPADEQLRLACCHAVGDSAGYCDTGSLSTFRKEYSGWNVLFGTGLGGKTLRLTVDSRLNLAAYQALGSRAGAVLVCDCETGELLCMVSTPDYDPAAPDTASHGAYLNRGLSCTYVPGSVFKLFTAAAALESVPHVEDMHFSCTGRFGTVTCPKVHGETELFSALAVSCNCAFAQLAELVGARRLEEAAARFGFTEKLAVSGIATAAGSFDFSADHCWSAVGQGKDMVCPASLLRFVTAAVNGGKAPELTLLPGKTQMHRIMSSKTAAELSAMLDYCVAYKYGRDSFPGLTVGGKTGTAETGRGTSHSWFCGAAEISGKKLAFVVIAEDAGSGIGTAADIARQVLSAAAQYGG